MAIGKWGLAATNVITDIIMNEDGLSVSYSDGTTSKLNTASIGVCAGTDCTVDSWSKVATYDSVSEVISTKVDIAEFTSFAKRVTDLEEKHKEPEVPMETKSILTHNGERIEVTNFNNGHRTNTKYIMPDIKDITVHNNSVVIVEFVDGTKEKAVLSEEDNFSLEQGVSICLTKKIVGGSSIYNKLIDYMLLKYERLQKQKADEAAALKAATEKRRKYAEKKAMKKAAKREECVRTMQEAFSRALAEHNKCGEEACRSEE